MRTRKDCTLNMPSHDMLLLDDKGTDCCGFAIQARGTVHLFSTPPCPRNCPSV